MYSSQLTFPLNTLQPIPNITLNLPKIEYKPKKDIIIPFNKKFHGNPRFITFDNCFDFLINHITKYHGKVSRSLIKKYLPLCEVYDELNGVFRTADFLSKSKFNQTYQTLMNR
jgi:hypothetical protein